MVVSGSGPYDDSNIFARILRGEIPAKLIYDDAFAVAFPDIAPRARIHVLVIPRGRYVSLSDFAATAPDVAIAGFWRAVGTVAQQLGLEASGYRMLSNIGHDAAQEVPHFHVHLFGGQPLGTMLPPARALSDQAASPGRS